MDKGDKVKRKVVWECHQCRKALILYPITKPGQCSCGNYYVRVGILQSREEAVENATKQVAELIAEYIRTPTGTLKAFRKALT